MSPTTLALVTFRCIGTVILLYGTLFTVGTWVENFYWRTQETDIAIHDTYDYVQPTVWLAVPIVAGVLLLLFARPLATLITKGLS